MCKHENWYREPDEDYEDPLGPHVYRCSDCDCEIAVEYKKLGAKKITKDKENNTVETQEFKRTIIYYDDFDAS